MTTIDLILPALDEALALPALLARVPAGVRAIVVDNGSTDDTARVAAGLGATVVPEPIRGFGAACAAGLAASDADIVVFCDADGSIDLGDIWLVIDPVIRGDADLVVGARVPTARGAWPAHARLANRYLARRIRHRFGLDVSDLGPLRAMRRTMVIDLAIEDLDLSERPRNCLKRAQINTVGELLTKNEDDLLNITNFGQKSLDEVKQKLDERGLTLRG